MSGAEDLARLKVTIDKTNELLLSPDIKMMDVGDGVMRPTNALVMTNLATLLCGAMPYASVEEGLTGTVDGTNFSVLSSESDLYVNIYRNVSGAAVYVDNYPNGAATRRASETADAAYGLSQPRSLADEMPWAVVDKDYRAILGVKASGAAHALLDRLPGLDVIGDYSWAIADENGVVLLGIKWSGEVVIYGLGSGEVTAYADGPEGGQDIFALVGGDPYQLTSSGNSYSPVASDGMVRYIQRNGPISKVSVELPSVGSTAPFVTKFKHLVSYGQSLAMGSTSSAATTQAPVANRLFTLNSGVRLPNQDDTLTAAMVAPFKPMVAATTETPCVQMAAQLNRLRGVPKDSGLLVSCHGRGGYTISQLSKGTLYYANMMTAISAAKAECARLGKGYEVPFMHYRQGEADRAAADGYYYGMLRQLQIDFEADVKAITGQSGSIPIIVEQLSNITSYVGFTSSPVIFEQLKLSQDYPEKFICSGPSYHLAHASDGTHMQAGEYQRLGCGNARAAKGVLAGGGFLPVSATSAVRTGSKVVVEFRVPFPPLVIDTLNVLNPGNYGFRWADSTNSVTVIGVRIISESKVELTLSDVPTGSSAYVGIGDIGTAGSWGGPTSGMRTNIRDSSPDLDSFGNPVFNWACHQRISVTTA